jgi:hypothetical protein
LNGKVGGLLAFEDAAGIDANLVKLIGQVAPITH